MLQGIVVSYSISTSNHNPCLFHCGVELLYLIPFLHQTTTPPLSLTEYKCCILFHFYIKPQQTCRHICCMCVVSYSISTSNHNITVRPCFQFWLYLIPFLHQTTTKPKLNGLCVSCILFHFYIKPQQAINFNLPLLGCILFHFYIKPQQISIDD